MIIASRGLACVAMVLFILAALGIGSLGSVQVVPAGLAFFAGAFVWWGWS